MNFGKDMDLDRFEAALAAWGSDLSRWPSDARAAGQRILATDPNAAAALAEMAALEDELANLRRAEDLDPPALSASLAERILADAATAMPSRIASPSVPVARESFFVRIMALLGDNATALRPAAICAASAVVGLWLGSLAPEAVADMAVAMIPSDAAMEFARLETGEAMSMDLDWTDIEMGDVE